MIMRWLEIFESHSAIKLNSVVMWWCSSGYQIVGLNLQENMVSQSKELFSYNTLVHAIAGAIVSYNLNSIIYIFKKLLIITDAVKALHNSVTSWRLNQISENQWNKYKIYIISAYEYVMVVILI